MKERFYDLHSLLGFVIGEVLGLIYFTLIRMQSQMPVGGFGDTTIWGRSVADVIDWGFAFPSILGLVGMGVARLFPVPQLRERSGQERIALFVIFLALAGAMWYQSSHIVVGLG